jgi:FADH2 O2-dependent halogenase
VREQFAAARVAHPFVYAPRIAFRSAVVHGDGWAMLPSAAGVIDPLLSTGFPLTLLGVARLAEILGDDAPQSSRAARLDEYARLTQQELDATEQLVGALYDVMDDPELFKRLSLLYFAAASFSEAARRLGRPELAPGFLLCRHDAFAGEMAAILATIRASIGASGGSDRASLLARIDRAIEPFDVAGLRDRSRRDWYPVRADDLLAASARLRATDAEIERLLERSGFTRTAS